MRSAGWAGLAVMTGWLAVSAAALAGEGDVRATIDSPARVTVEPPADHASAQARPSQVVVSVTGFAPSPNGPVEAVVTVRCGAEEREIGRFGIFPHAAFSATRASQVQRFGFTWPEDGDCGPPTDLTVRLEASVGDGKDAGMTIGGATYR